MYSAFFSMLFVIVAIRLLLFDARDTSAYSKRDARQKRQLAYAIIAVLVVWLLYRLLG